MKAMIVIGFVFLVGFILFLQKSTTIATPSPTPTRYIISASFYPLAEFAHQVGKDYIQVHTIIPWGEKPDVYQPTPNDLAKIQESIIFIYNAGLEPWVAKLLPGFEKNNILIVEAGNMDNSIKNNPYVWLDPLLAAKEVNTIKDALIRTDPEHTNEYEENTKTYKKKLLELDETYKQELAKCRIRTIITSHETFAHLARRYNLTMVPIGDVSIQNTLPPKIRAEVMTTVRQKGVRTIFLESVDSPKWSETTARELGITTGTLNPIEGLSPEEISQGKDYISIQMENLQKLREALGCVGTI